MIEVIYVHDDRPDLVVLDFSVHGHFVTIIWDKLFNTASLFAPNPLVEVTQYDMDCIADVCFDYFK